MAGEVTGDAVDDVAGTTLRDWWLGASALLGVAGLAITQPVLDLFGRNPEFFVAGRYGAGQIVTFALVVALGPGLVAIAVTSVARLVHPRVGVIVHAVVLWILAFLFGLVVLGNLGVDVAWVALSAAGIVACVVVLLERTRPAMRTLLSYLVVGNVAFVALFLFASPTAELVAGSDGSAAAADGTDGSGGVRSVPDLQGPVVFVILDEFPVTTLMRADGTINAERYPNFARLAESSTWFRNASSLSSLTSLAVPSMLTGRRPDPDALPSYLDHPRSFLTLFGDRYPVNLYESVTDMCPPSVCEPAARGSVGTALHDGLVVYEHQVLPADMAEDLDLPSIDHSWGSFGDEVGATGGGSEGAGDDVGDADRDGDGDGHGDGVTATTVPTAADGIVGESGYGRWESLSPDERRSHGQLSILRQMVERIDARPSVNFVHVALPHYPWSLTPWGTRLTQAPAKLDDMDGPAAREMNGRLRYQLHSLQVGAVDGAIGEMIDHLEAVGAWDDALVVVTSDHGTSLLLPDFGRQPTERNEEERLRMPLFVKAPGQRAGDGEVSDEVAQTVDILPSIVDLLGVRTDWAFDGHSLYDGSKARRPPEVDESVEPALAIAARHAGDFGGDGWDGLAELGIARDLDLVGRSMDAVTVGEPSGMTWSAEDEDLFDALPTPDGRMPYLVVGQVTVPDEGPPPQILLVVNGTIAGVAATDQRAGDGWQVMGVVGPYLRTGRNTVDAYEVERTGLGPVLHALSLG
jgi:hypothetical protein